MQLFIFFFPKYIYYIQTPNACFSFNSFFQVQAVLFWPCLNTFSLKRQLLTTVKMFNKLQS